MEVRLPYLQRKAKTWHRRSPSPLSLSLFQGGGSSKADLALQHGELLGKRKGVLRCCEMASFSEGPPTAPPSRALVRASHFASAPRPVDSSRRQDDEKKRKKKQSVGRGRERGGRWGPLDQLSICIFKMQTLSVD